MNAEEVGASEHEQIELLLPWYANGTLSEDERRRVATHLEGCERCRTELDECEMIGEAVSRPGVSPIVPAPDVAGLLARVDESEAKERRAVRRWPLLAAAASAVLALSVILFVGSNEPEAPQFNLATGAAGEPRMDLVFDITFSGSVDDRERERILDAFGLPVAGERVAERRYRVETTGRVMSPEEIRRLTEELAAAEGVVSAEVAMLPPGN